MYFMADRESTLPLPHYFLERDTLRLRGYSAQLLYYSHQVPETVKYIWKSMKESRALAEPQQWPKDTRRVLKAHLQRKTQYPMSFHFKFCTNHSATLLLMGRKGFLKQSTFIFIQLAKATPPQQLQRSTGYKKAKFCKMKGLALTCSYSVETVSFCTKSSEQSAAQCQKLLTASIKMSDIHPLHTFC